MAKVRLDALTRAKVLLLGFSVIPLGFIAYHLFRLIGIDEVQKSLNRSRASVYRYTNTDSRNLNPPFNPRKLNPEYRSDQKDPLMFHPNEVARFAKDILRIKEVTVEVLNSPSTVTQNVLESILEELKIIRMTLEAQQKNSSNGLDAHVDQHGRPAA